MIEIPPVDATPLEKRGKTSLGKTTRRTSPSLFRTKLLSEVEESRRESQEELESLLQRLEEAGNDLERGGSMASYRAFRELLGVIVRRLLQRAFRIERTGGTPLDPRFHERVAVIDREADDLLRLVLARQKDRIAIARKVIEIKGLVIDLIS